MQSQETRAQDEDAVVQEASLRESHEQVQDMVRMERSELNLIGEQCLKDIRSIGKMISFSLGQYSRGTIMYIFGISYETKITRTPNCNDLKMVSTVHRTQHCTQYIVCPTLYR